MAATRSGQEITVNSHHEAMKLLLTRVHGELELMCEETESAVVAELPEVAQRADAAVRRRVVVATFYWVLRRLAGDDGPDPNAELHRGFGAAAAHAGVPLEQLVAGYHIGSRVGWAHIRRAVQDLGLGGEVGMLLADAQLAHMHELTTQSMIGYTHAVRRAHEQRSHWRQTLVDALMAGNATPDMAARAGWTWGTELAVAVILGDSLTDASHSAEVLLGTTDGAVVAIGRADALVNLLNQQHTAVIGPTVSTNQARLSFDRARKLANLVATGVLPRQGLVRWTDELATMLVHGTPEVAVELVERRLGRLRDASAQREQMLRETLAAWLDHPGQPQAIAQALHLHAQTVRYRLTRLRERLGDDLDNPQARFEFALALRYQGTGA